LKALNFLCGNWRTEGEVLGDLGEMVNKIAGTDSYVWVSERIRSSSSVDVSMGDTKTEVTEVIGSYDSADDSNALRSFDNDGNFITMKGRFEKNGVFKIEGEGMRCTLTYNQSQQSMTISWERL
jgi:hypothetical protein